VSTIEILTVVAVLIAAARITGRLDRIHHTLEQTRRLAEARELRERALFGPADAREELRK
jgi:hypothetical protein